jgi:hypothetical protein
VTWWFNSTVLIQPSTPGTSQKKGLNKNLLLKNDEEKLLLSFGRLWFNLLTF